MQDDGCEKAPLGAGLLSIMPRWLLMSKPMQWLGQAGGRLNAAQMNVIWGQIMDDVEATSKRETSRSQP